MQDHLQERSHNTADPLDAALKERGIQTSAATFRDLVVRAVDSLLATRPMDPSKGLSSSELSALKQGGFDLSEREEERSPLVETAATFAAMVATSMHVGEVAVLLGVNESRVRQRLGNHTLYGIKLGGRWLLPRFQFHEGDEVPGFAGVLATIDRELHPMAIQQWFYTPNVDLVVGDTIISPIEWLLSGRPVDAVKTIADAL